MNMEGCGMQMEENHIRMYKTRELPQNKDDYAKVKMKELVEIQEELKKARESATQSWLDSKPLIDELEKQQSELATAKNRTSMSNVIISDLKSQLQAVNSDMKFRMVEELEATKIANEMSGAVEQTRRELETIKAEIVEERKTRADLKQVLRTRKLTLRALQLTLRAILVESKVLETSLAEAKRLKSILDTENSTVKISQEEYFVLKQRAKDEAALAEWRVSVSSEQKLAAEASRNLALSRLRDLYSDQNKSRRWEMSEEHVEEEEEEKEHVRRNKSTGVVGPRARVEATRKSGRRGTQQMRRSKGVRNKRLAKKKKPSSIFSKIKSFLVRSFRKLFG